MKQRDHSELVSALSKSGVEIAIGITGAQAHLLHMCMGIAGETGELVDAIKKHVIYNKPIDLENVVEELGDIEFYLEGLRQGLGLNRDSILAHNIEKLSKRYAKGSYSNEQAQARADKV